jgi:hypothetical protein
MKSTKSEFVEIMAARSACVVTGVASRVASGNRVLVGLDVSVVRLDVSEWRQLLRL